MMREGQQNLSESVQGSWHDNINNNNKKASLNSFVYFITKTEATVVRTNVILILLYYAFHFFCIEIAAHVQCFENLFVSYLNIM